MSFPKQKKPRSWRVLQDWIRHYADQEELPQSRVLPRALEHWLDSLDEALAEDMDDFSYSRDEPVQIRSTNSFRVNIIIDYKGRRWGKVQLEVAPVEVEGVLDIGSSRSISVNSASSPQARSTWSARDLLEPADLIRVRDACEAIFAARAKQPWPPELIVYPSWAETYRALAEGDGFPITPVAEAASQVHSFIEEIDTAHSG